MSTLNADLERRVAERTAELEASNARLRESERRRSLALAAGQMGSWDWDIITGECQWDAGQYRIFGVEPGRLKLTLENIGPLIHPDDLARIEKMVRKGATEGNTFQTEARIVRPDGQTRWCICAAAMTVDTQGMVTRVSGVTIDITELKEAEERRTLLVREVDHRARNALAIVQSIVRMTKSKSIDSYVSTVEGRIAALSTAHALLAELRWEGASLNRLVDEELAPYRSGELERIDVDGPAVFLKPETAQIIALVLHELATNAVKYGALSDAAGKVSLSWQCQPGQAQSAVGRKRRTGGQSAGDQGLRNQGHHRKHRAAAQWQEHFRLAAGWTGVRHVDFDRRRLGRSEGAIAQAAGGRLANGNGSKAAVKNGRVLAGRRRSACRNDDDRFSARHRISCDRPVRASVRGDRRHQW